ncbi:MAG TPA: TlpA disulfide reductase family protein [Candidatus Binataceae bacterium]|nr:TlpA disulfide reductase family protein [Candidatus Binataceae bacterium]
MDPRNKLLYLASAGILFAGIVLLVVASVRSGRNVPSGGAGVAGGRVAAGDRAANFNLDSLDGHKVSLEALRGKVVFLNVWATWCGPCLQEMPSMETLFDELKSRSDFVMLAVSQDTRGRDAIQSYVRKNGFHFTVLLDPENTVGETYEVSGVPETFIIDRAGRIVAHHMGAFDWSRPDVKAALLELLDSRQG